MKRCSTSLLLERCRSKLQWGTTSHWSEWPSLTSINNKCWRRCGEKGSRLHCSGEYKLGQPLWKTVWRFLRKLKRELPYDPAIPLLGIHLDKTIIKDVSTPMVVPEKTSISALLTMPKPLTVWITTNCGKFLKKWKYQTTCPASWEIYMQVKKQQLELDMQQQTGSK